MLGEAKDSQRRTSALRQHRRRHKKRVPHDALANPLSFSRQPANLILWITLRFRSQRGIRSTVTFGKGELSCQRNFFLR